MTNNITPIEYKWNKCSEKFPKEYSWVKINICYHREDCDVNYSKIAHFRKGVFEFEDGGRVIVKPKEPFYLYNQKESREVTHWMVDYPPQALAPQERRRYEYKSVYPDTPQECDVTKCEFYYVNKVGENIYQACSCYTQTNDEGYLQDTLCSDNPNCYYKQLNSQEKKDEEIKNLKLCLEELLKNRLETATCQDCYDEGCRTRKLIEKYFTPQQKTFTVEEIKNKVHSIVENKCGDCGDCGSICLVDMFEDCIIAEFEKEVG